MVPNCPNTMTHPHIPQCWETRSIVSVDQLQKASKNLLFSTTRLVVPVYCIFSAWIFTTDVIPLYINWLKRKKRSWRNLCVHACVQMQGCPCVCTNSFSFLFLQHMCMGRQGNVCVCIYTYICICVCKCVYTYIYTHACIFMHMYVHTYMCLRKIMRLRHAGILII